MQLDLPYVEQIFMLLRKKPFFSCYALKVVPLTCLNFWDENRVIFLNTNLISQASIFFANIYFGKSK